MTEYAYEYIEARRTLLDALDALAPHRDSLVLIGAQAVYLHTGSTGLSVPPMTTDADVVRGLRILSERATDIQHDLPTLAERASRGDPTVAPSFVILVLELLAAVST